MVSETGDTLTGDMDMTSDDAAEIKFINIAVGTWYLTVNAYDASSKLLYTGSAELEVLAGTMTQVSLVLNPTGMETGSVLINVTWGTSVKTLVLQPGPEGKDAIVSSLRHDQNYGVYQNIYMSSWTNDGELNNVRTYIDFNLTAIPSSAKIISAKLYLYWDYANGFGYQVSPHSGDNAFTVTRVTGYWGEYSLTWDNQPNVTYEDSVYVPQSVYGDQNYVIDITQLAQDYINDPQHSFGFMCKLINENPYSLVILAASDHFDPAVRPKLVISYQ
jgi:hypothetical protein